LKNRMCNLKVAQRLLITIKHKKTAPEIIQYRSCIDSL
jgi:hypothetical protein